MKKTILLIIFLLGIFLIGFDSNANEEKTNFSKIYKDNIANIEKTMRQIEDYVETNGLKDVYTKYPKYFAYRLRNCELNEYYQFEEFFGWFNRSIIKFDIIECGRVDEYHKYIKCNIWTRYRTFGDSIFLKKEFGSYQLFEKLYLVCDNQFSDIIEAYDDLETYKVVNQMKKFKNASKVKVIQCHFDYDKMQGNYDTRNLTSDEINILIDFIGKIKFKWRTDVPREVRRYLIKPETKLIIEYENTEYPIWIDTSHNVRLIYFVEQDLLTFYNIDNKLFFKLFYDHLASLNNYYLFFEPDDFEGNAFPDFLIQTLSNDTQEIICKAKMKHIILEWLNPDCSPELWLDKDMKYKVLKYEESITQYLKKVEEYINTEICLRQHKKIFPYCPSNNKNKYGFKVEPGVIEINCPTHGKQRINFE